MNDTGLAAETRRLLDAATGDSEDGNTGAELFDMFIDGGGDIVYWPDGDAVAHVYPGVMTGVEPQALAALIAAAPRLLANWLARNEQTEAVEDDLGRIANENAALAGRLMAERDRLADENRALREGIDRAVSYLKLHSDANGNGLDGFDVRLVASNLATSLAAAADRGVTDGERNEGGTDG